MALGVQRLFDNNIKVHFAGSEGNQTVDCALRAANVRYRLFSCYKFIVSKKRDSNFELPYNNVIRYGEKYYRHTIQDSGLFTLMFGAAKGCKLTMQDMIEWQDKLIAFVQQNNLKCTCVEMDVQKVLGVNEAWDLRYRMRKLLKNRQINVFHYEDGKDGLDRLIDFSDYIAISVPEMRIIKPGTFRGYVHQLAWYIKNRKPEIDIHLLGCTDFKMLKENKFCTTADSTSWLSGIKFGSFGDGKVKSHIRNLKRDMMEQRKALILPMLDDYGIKVAESTLDYTVRSSLCATICKQRYTEMAGSQE